VQEPEHCPAVHAPLAQAWVVPQFPVASHVCTPVPMHWTAPGAHEPWHEAPVELATQV
jgi:hypothetical protein